MATGIRIIGNSGSILIDDTYRNMAVVGSGTQANTTSASGRIYRAVQADDYYSLIPINGYTTPTHRWWDYGYPPNGTITGIKVFNSSGQCCFNSSLKYARVVDVFDFNQYTPMSKTYPAGRTYAVIQAKPGFVCDQITRQDPNSTTGWYNYARRFLPLMTKVVSNVVWVKIYDGDWAEPITWSGPLKVIPSPWQDDIKGKFIVLDVTGY